MINNLVLEIVKSSVWENNRYNGECIDDRIYDIFEQHALLALPTPILSVLSMSPELREKWKKKIAQQIYYYHIYCYAQESLHIQVPYLILKGTTAAQYYHHPEYRTMGDIDIITQREHFSEACSMLLDDGYCEISSKNELKTGRHRSFLKNSVHIEVHHFFSLMNDTIHAKYIDDLIIQNINASHILPDLVNGLVILEHINQHLENGLGLRQVIDWMMFVDKCLSDRIWPDFENIVEASGLKTLAIVITRMCEIYLGLHEHNWCREVDTDLCEELMSYILRCGNFGNKRVSDLDVSENVFVIARNPKAIFHLLQERGLKNWKLSKKYTILQPVAWIYQAGRYIVKGLGSKDSSIKLISSAYKKAKRRSRMFDILGVRQASKGHIILHEGEFKKV